MKIFELLKEPEQFFENIREETWKPAFLFFLKITLILAIFTPIVNFFGIESSDYSSAYQAQIIAYRLMKLYLINSLGIAAYFIESLLIIFIAVILLFALTGFIHLIYRLLAGKGSILNAWKAVCYGLGPCIFGGFLPYISLFAAFYSFLFQLYLGPKVLYRVKESKAILVLAILIASTFIEMFLVGTTVGF